MRVLGELKKEGSKRKGVLLVQILCVDIVNRKQKLGWFEGPILLDKSVQKSI